MTTAGFSTMHSGTSMNWVRANASHRNVSIGNVTISFSTMLLIPRKMNATARVKIVTFATFPKNMTHEYTSG